MKKTVRTIYGTDITLTENYKISKRPFGRLKLVCNDIGQITDPEITTPKVDFGIFNTNKVISIDSNYFGDNVVAITFNQKTWTFTLTQYGIRKETTYMGSTRYIPYVVSSVSSKYPINKIIQYLPDVFDTDVYELLSDDGKESTLYVADHNSSRAYKFNTAQFSNAAPLGSVIVRKKICAAYDKLSQSQDILTFGFNPIVGAITTDVYSEARNETITLEHIKKVADEKNITDLAALYFETEEYLNNKPGMYEIFYSLMHKEKVRSK